MIPGAGQAPATGQDGETPKAQDGNEEEIEVTRGVGRRRRAMATENVLEGAERASGDARGDGVGGDGAADVRYVERDYARDGDGDETRRRRGRRRRRANED